MYRVGGSTGVRGGWAGLQAFLGATMSAYSGLQMAG